MTATRTYQVSREQLKQVQVLCLLEDDVLDQVLKLSRHQHYAKHETILMKGIVNDWLGILLAGHVQVVDALASGLEVGLDLIRPGHFFGEFAVIDRQPRSVNLVAISPCDVIQIPGEVARQLFFRYPPVAEAIQLHFTRIIRRNNEMRSLVSMPQASHRVIALLLVLSGSSHGGLVVIDVLPTHQELAIMANTSRETVSRTLSELMRQGLIEKDLRRLIIRHKERLQQLLTSEA